MFKRIWLIQRLIKPTKDWESNPFIFGGGYKWGGLTKEAMDMIKDVFEFDYMGAAEFEHGAVPEALQKISSYAENHTLIKDSFRPSRRYEKTCYYICCQYHEKEIKDFIKSLLKSDKPRLKENTCFQNSMENEEFCRKFVGWLELDNGFFFFTDKEMFEKTCLVFGLK